MAHLVSLNNEILSNVAQQVGDFLSQGIVSFDNAEQLQIAEGFPVWLLQASEIFNESINERFQPTGYWHFQVHNSNKPRAFARAKILGPKSRDWVLSSVFESQLSTNIDEAISIVDKLDIEGEARILEIPAWLMSALWINNKNKRNTYVIVNVANRDNIPLLSPFNDEEFFSLLRSLPIVEGRVSNY